MPQLQIKKVLIVVRTYPIPVANGVEVSCTAGITDGNQWVRLFPVPYRFLRGDRRFHKYQWIEAKVFKSKSDQRPESYKLDPESINILSEPLSTGRGWQARKNVLFRLKVRSLCQLRRERDQRGWPTLGFFRPKAIHRLIIKPESPNWSDNQLAMLRQGSLFEKGPVVELEKVPYSFKYQFSCDDDQCAGHNMVCTDWEMGESWRKWKNDYGENWESKFRQRYEEEMISKNDTHFYVGTVFPHPQTWIIVGLFYPPLQQQRDLFSFE